MAFSLSPPRRLHLSSSQSSSCSRFIYLYLSMCLFLFPLLWVGAFARHLIACLCSFNLHRGSDSFGARRFNHVEDDRQTSPHFVRVSHEQKRLIDEVQRRPTMATGVSLAFAAHSVDLPLVHLSNLSREKGIDRRRAKTRLAPSVTVEVSTFVAVVRQSIRNK